MRALNARARRALTLIEVAISTVLMLLVGAATMGLMRVSGDTSNVVYVQTQVQMESQRVLKFVRDELALTSVGGSGAMTYNPAPAAPAVWELRYRRLDPSAPIWAGGFDPTDPYGLTNIQWSTDEFVLRYEITDGPTAGVDDDKDYLIDEGRLAFYRNSGGGAADVLVWVVADDITAFTVTDNITTALPDERPRVGFTITMERVLQSAVVTAQDAQAVIAGGGPRVSYTGQVWVAMRN